MNENAGHFETVVLVLFLKVHARIALWMKFLSAPLFFLARPLTEMKTMRQEIKERQIE